MELSYKEAMEFFLEMVTENSNLHYKTNFSILTPPTYTIKGGRKYDKVTTDSSVYCFVEKETGNVYKPAGWRAPYTKGNNPVRGNIFNVSSYENADPYGGWLYKR